jgi:hypothetical protein
MNYCTIEDAWKNSDYISDQFKIYENPNEKKNIIENFESSNQQNNNQQNNNQRNNNQQNNNQQNNNQQTDNRPNSKFNNKQINYQIDNNRNNLDKVCSFSCDDFWEHLNSCQSCRTKIRNRFSSKVIERIQNIVLDNKDTILLILMAVFILVFFNLLISIFKK